MSPVEQSENPNRSANRAHLPLLHLLIRPKECHLHLQSTPPRSLILHSLNVSTAQEKQSKKENYIERSERQSEGT